jgi:hypothetical protein
MNKYLKNYLQRGVAFGGFGPIIAGIVLFIIDRCGVEVELSGTQVLLMVVSTYILAFVQAGASVFNQIESWCIAKSMALHFSSLYIAYIGCYLLNSWLPFKWEVIAIFTAIFVGVYLVIWLTVFLIVKTTSKKLNKRFTIK